MNDPEICVLSASASDDTDTFVWLGCFSESQGVSGQRGPAGRCVGVSHISTKVLNLSSLAQTRRTQQFG